jgi:hypothetical protein
MIKRVDIFERPAVVEKDIFESKHSKADSWTGNTSDQVYGRRLAVEETCGNDSGVTVILSC